MELYRYGKFRFGDYWESWICASMYLVIAILCSVIISPLLGIMPLFFSLNRIRGVICPNREKFQSDGDMIITQKGEKQHIIKVPPDAIFIISLADICPPFAMRTAGKNETHILKDKYAVSILQNMPLEKLLDCLHRNYITEYTTSMIEQKFTYQFVYSYVCDNNMLNELVCGKKNLVILPESLMKKVSVDRKDVYIDIGF